MLTNNHLKFLLLNSQFETHCLVNTSAKLKPHFLNGLKLQFIAKLKFHSTTAKQNVNAKMVKLDIYTPIVNLTCSGYNYVFSV